MKWKRTEAKDGDGKLEVGFELGKEERRRYGSVAVVVVEVVARAALVRS